MKKKKVFHQQSCRRHQSLINQGVKPFPHVRVMKIVIRKKREKPAGKQKIKDKGGQSRKKSKKKKKESMSLRYFTSRICMFNSSQEIHAAGHVSVCHSINAYAQYISVCPSCHGHKQTDKAVLRGVYGRERFFFFAQCVLYLGLSLSRVNFHSDRKNSQRIGYVI